MIYFNRTGRVCVWPTRCTFGIVLTDSSFEINLAPAAFLKLKTIHSDKYPMVLSRSIHSFIPCSFCSFSFSFSLSLSLWPSFIFSFGSWSNGWLHCSSPSKPPKPEQARFPFIFSFESTVWLHCSSPSKPPKPEQALPQKTKEPSPLVAQSRLFP